MAAQITFRQYLESRARVAQPNLAAPSNDVIPELVEDNYETLVPLLIMVGAKFGEEDTVAFISISDTTGSVQPPDPDADIDAINDAFLERSRSNMTSMDIRQLDEDGIIAGLRAKRIRIDKTWYSRVLAAAKITKQTLQDEIGGRSSTLSQWVVALSSGEELRFDFATLVMTTHNYEVALKTRVSNTKGEQVGASKLRKATRLAMREHIDTIASNLSGGSGFRSGLA